VDTFSDPLAGPLQNVVVLGASRGGVAALREIVADLPDDLAAAVLIVVHIGPTAPSQLPVLLSRWGRLPAVHGHDGQTIRAGHIYVAPPDWHMQIAGGHIHLNQGPKEHHTRPAADPLFRSAARCYGARAIGIVLTGGDHDGTEGLRAIAAAGGTAIVQRPDDAQDPSMPRSAIKGDHPDYCVPVAEIGKLIVRLVGETQEAGTGDVRPSTGSG